MTDRAQWRSLDALAETPEFRSFVAREFPAVTDLSVGPERRGFLKLMAASFAMAGLSGCDDKPDGRSQEVPYVRSPERMQPGSRLSYASATLLDGLANGVLVTTVNGRPLKIEGHPDHPWSRGGTDVQGQASILGLYDPGRSQSVQRLGRTSTMTAFRGATTGPLAAMRAGGGEGMRLLTGPVSSPSLVAGIAAMQAAYTKMVWHSHTPSGRDAVYEGTRRAFGRRLEPRYRFEQARVIVGLDADFLDAGPHQVGMARDWIDARRAALSRGELLTMHAAGPLPSLTRAKADHEAVATQTQLMALAQDLLADVAAGAAAPAADPSPLGVWRARVVAALGGARGQSLVIAGTMQDPALQALAHRLNVALGNLDATVFYTEPAVAEAADLPALVTAMQAGSVQALVMLETNPVYAAPGSLDFTAALTRVPLKIHAGAYADETALRSDWHLPTAHPLESWGDARAVDGTISLLQPTIAPLYDGHSPAEIVALLTDGQDHAGLDLLRAQYKVDAPAWEAMLHDGFVPGSAATPASVTLTPPTSAAPATAGLDVLFRPDPSVWDGAVAENAWLQELPKPLTKLVWDNAFAVAPAFASAQQLKQGDIVTLAAAGRSIEGPVWIQPGQADATIGVTLGYGRDVPGGLAYRVGTDVTRLQDAATPWQLSGVTLTKTGRNRAFATTQDHSTMEGHDFVRVQTLGAAPVGETALPARPSLLPEKPSDGRAWGMVIDLDACMGCNACVTACQSENNIAVVGREQVAMGREMHWLRIDRYHEGPVDAPVTHFQPVPCMHCEDAPCEVGCPVEATLHDQEGLNLMVYNRCVGTRACSGYCPYKVRHFNYLDYSAGAAPSRALQYNPEVTVRARGVMEKCTYCVQRIAAARIDSDTSHQPITDGTVQTACQGACPTRAISFGDLSDPHSAVTAARADPRNYALLGELNVRPRTTYLAKIAPADPAPGDPT